MHSVWLFAAKASAEPGGRLENPFLFAWFFPTNSFGSCVIESESSFTPVSFQTRVSEHYSPFVCGQSNAALASLSRGLAVDASIQHFGRQKWYLECALGDRES